MNEYYQFITNLLENILTKKNLNQVEWHTIQSQYSVKQFGCVKGKTQHQRNATSDHRESNQHSKCQFCTPL